MRSTVGISTTSVHARFMRRSVRSMVHMGRYYAALLLGESKQSILWSFDAENSDFRQIRNYVARMRGPQPVKLALDLTRTNTPRDFSI